MTVDIPREYEEVLRKAVASGAFANPEAALRHALDLLADEQQETKAETGAPAKDDVQWSARFRAWAAGHPKSNRFVDDSRESIYEGRGL